MNIGELLKAYRKNSGFTQEEVANKIQVSRATVSSWETGRTFPDIEKIINLSDLYHVSLDQLLREEPRIMENIKTERKRLKHYLLIKKIAMGLVAILCVYHLFWLVTIHPKNQKLSNWQVTESGYVMTKNDYTFSAQKIDYLRALTQRNIVISTQNQAPFKMILKGDSLYVLVFKTNAKEKGGSSINPPKDFHFMAKMKKDSINDLEFEHYEGSISAKKAKAFIKSNQSSFNQEYHTLDSVWQTVNK